MKLKQTLLLGLLSGLSAFGFSPYENYLMSGEPTHVALFASAADGKINELATALKTLNGKNALKSLKKVAISNVSTYAKDLQGKTWYLIYFDYDGENYLDAVKAFESVEDAKALSPLVAPHPRAKANGTSWLQLEWMNYIRGSQKKDKPANRFAMVTRIKPEKEQEYRILHQTVWPGVVDQMVRGNYRDFSIFFIEIGDELYEFFHVDYVGTDAGKDGKMNSGDPFNQRWWKITDACQNPLPDANGIWSMMNKISE